MTAAWRVVLISDFNVGSLRGLLENDEAPPPLQVTTAPFGDVAAALVDPAHPALAAGADAAVVWTRPEGVVPSFGDLLAGRDAALESVLIEVDAFAAQLAAFATRVPRVLVPTWVVPTHLRGLGAIDLRPGGLARTLVEMNHRLLRRLDDLPAIVACDAQRWIAAVGPAAHDARAWYMGKIPFAAEVFREAAHDLKAALAASAGLGRKLIVVDLDDTLWGGLVGEVGWESLVLGGHDPVGEAFADVQRALQALRRRGILLAIASKNDETVALEALRRHPEMVLRPDDFVAWRIDWGDKAAHVAALARELNLDLDAVVFIDDSPAERARVREALPQVLVPEWPEQKLLRAAALQALRCFDVAAVSAEDRARSELYAAERRRGEARAAVTSVADWQRSLDLQVTVGTLARPDLKRVVQLLNKTNQMNLRTRRTTESELAAWAEGAGRRLWALRARDRFGDAGLIGVVSAERAGDAVHVVDFVLSCRVFGREIERVMVRTVVEHARAAGAATVVAEYLPTPRNAPTLEFWRRSGFAEQSGVFRWRASDPYLAPDFIAIEPAAG
ncbi:MAG TPA: HAD-IIIC family phosphatase [Candidatus Binatia bacterium]|jgi:FkbH-like protein